MEETLDGSEHKQGRAICWAFLSNKWRTYINVRVRESLNYSRPADFLRVQFSMGHLLKEGAQVSRVI